MVEVVEVAATTIEAVEAEEASVALAEEAQEAVGPLAIFEGEKCREVGCKEGQRNPANDKVHRIDQPWIALKST